MALRKLAAAAVAGLKPRSSSPLTAMSRILHRDPSSGVRRFGTPALGHKLEQNNININNSSAAAVAAAADDNLILLVDPIKNKKHHNISILSMENNLLKSVVPNRLNFSRLNSRGTRNEFLAFCDKWLVFASGGRRSKTPTDLMWDLTTDEIRHIPQFPMKPRLPSSADSPYTLWGVGFDSGSGDYKVVRASNEKRAELLSLNTGLWREIRFPHSPDKIVVDNVRSVHINGVYYWTAHLKDDERDAILRFDFGRQEFPADLIHMPKVVTNWAGPIKPVLVNYHGSLAVILQKDCLAWKDIGPIDDEKENNHNNPLWFEIWAWSHADRSWSRVSTNRVPVNADVTEVVGLCKNSDKVILLDSVEGSILLYDCGTTELESFRAMEGCGESRRVSSQPGSKMKDFLAGGVPIVASIVKMEFDLVVLWQIVFGK
ncbi:F-box protein [Striga asiatica]|uniref:F-box protein n=1 Tax=Striga asiatica TaxID=4170 RepID=A0A5A7PL81_STRAF|nr:F-box protein [Striga asiatica]